MGTTLSSIHIFTSDALETMKDCYSFSEGWQTYMPAEQSEEPWEFRKLAKGISKRVDAPVLWFYIFDSEAIWFEFYEKGKRVSAYSSEDMTGTKNLYGIPKLVGYEDGNKRRLSRILSSADVDFQIELLEEYFGVCLTPFPDLLNEGADALRRVRGDAKYQLLLEEDRKITGKQAPMKVELVWERLGKIFECRFGEDHDHFKPKHYYFGYDSFLSNFGQGNLRPVRFADEELVGITQEEFDGVPQMVRGDARKDARIEEIFGLVYKVHFTNRAPKEFSGKTLVPPRGFYFFCFDDKGRVILSDEKGGLAVADESLQVIARMRVKGMPVDYMNGYILTAGSHSFYAYAYDPSDKVRIYRIVEK